MALTILTNLKWYGVAMVEFKYDPRDNQPKLLEINPRFWGSLELAIKAGVNFPYLLYKVVMDEEIEPVMKYKLGVRCRWLLPGDLCHFLANPKRFSLQPSFFKFYGTAYDILSWRDPLPVLGTLLSGLEFVYNSELKNFLRR
jgi:predicted ATP-grasp superfamily ATP-dependent carboligase